MRKPRVWRKVLVADRPIKYWIVLLSVSQFDSLGKQQIRPGIASQYRWGRRWSWALHDSFSTSLSSLSTWADTWPLQCQHLNKYGIYSAYIYICINNIYIYVYIYMYVCVYICIYICISMDMGPIQRFPRLQEFISTFLVSKHHQDLQNNMDCATLQSWTHWVPMVYPSSTHRWGEDFDPQVWRISNKSKLQEGSPRYKFVYNPILTIDIS